MSGPFDGTWPDPARDPRVFLSKSPPPIGTDARREWEAENERWMKENWGSGDGKETEAQAAQGPAAGGPGPEGGPDPA